MNFEQILLLHILMKHSVVLLAYRIVFPFAGLKGYQFIVNSSLNQFNKIMDLRLNVLMANCSTSSVVNDPKTTSISLNEE